MAVVDIEHTVQVGIIPIEEIPRYWKGELTDPEIARNTDYFDTRCFIPEHPITLGVNHDGLYSFVRHDEEHRYPKQTIRSIEGLATRGEFTGQILVSSYIEIKELNEELLDLGLREGIYAEDHIRLQSDWPLGSNPEHVYPHDTRHGHLWLAIGHAARHIQG